MMKRTILSALVLSLAVSGQARRADDAPQRQWSVVNRDNGVIEEGFTVDGNRVGRWTIKVSPSYVLSGPYVDGERHGLWEIMDSDRTYTTYYVRGTDIHNAFRIKVDDVESLLEFMDVAGVGVNERVFYHGSAAYLHAAIDYGGIEVVRALLDMGADPNLEPYGMGSWRTAVWAAISDHRCDFSDLEVLGELVKAGGDITVRNGESDTLLHKFARVWECDDVAAARAIVGRLISLGLDIETENQNESTPLNEAAKKKRSVSVVRALIESGADVDSRDRFGRTPLHNVTMRRPTPVTAEIVEYDVTPGIYVRSVRENARQQSGIGLLLLRNGADPGVRDADGRRPLDGIEEGSSLRRTRFYRQLARRT